MQRTDTTSDFPEYDDQGAISTRAQSLTVNQDYRPDYQEYYPAEADSVQYGSKYVRVSVLYCH